MGSAERRRGHVFERYVVNLLKERGYDAASSRYASYYLDSKGIDVSSDDFPLKIQCKSLSVYPNPTEIFDETEADVIFWRKTKKNKENGRFYIQGEYAILKIDLLLDLIDKIQDHEQV